MFSGPLSLRAYVPEIKFNNNKIKSDTDHHRLQTDLDKLTEWAMAWDMQFHPANVKM